jgi:hypothetical protein
LPKPIYQPDADLRGSQEKPPLSYQFENSSKNEEELAQELRQEGGNRTKGQTINLRTA